MSRSYRNPFKDQHPQKVGAEDPRWLPRGDDWGQCGGQGWEQAQAPVSVAERADASWAAMRKIVGSRLKALEVLGGICGR